MLSAYRQLHLHSLPSHLSHSVPAQNTLPTASSLQHPPAIFDHSHPLPSRFLLSHPFLLPLPLSKHLFHSLETIPHHQSAIIFVNCLIYNSSQCTVPVICIAITSLQRYLKSSSRFPTITPTSSLHHSLPFLL